MARWVRIDRGLGTDGGPSVRAAGRGFGAAVVTNVFAVVGEHRDEPGRLLLLGDDGHFYAYGTEEGRPTQIEPSADWEIDLEAAALFGNES